MFKFSQSHRCLHHVHVLHVHYREASHSTIAMLKIQWRQEKYWRWIKSVKIPNDETSSRISWFFSDLDQALISNLRVIFISLCTVLNTCGPLGWGGVRLGCPPGAWGEAWCLTGRRHCTVHRGIQGFVHRDTRGFVHRFTQGLYTGVLRVLCMGAQGYSSLTCSTQWFGVETGW